MRGRLDGEAEKTVMTKSCIEGGSVGLVVLGDMGRSPRMLYHAIELLKRGAEVHMIGYSESDLPDALVRDARFKPHPIAAFPTVLERIPYALKALLKALWLVIALCIAVMAHFVLRNRPRFVIVQNPPAIPSIFVVTVLIRLFLWRPRCRIAIDWHNLAHSLTPGRLSSVAKYLEYRSACFANLHICVTNAMQEHLRVVLPQYRKSLLNQVNTLVLHDRPADRFRPLGDDEKHSVRSVLLPDIAWTSDSKLIVSGTSWTPDEDFSVLLNAIEALDRVLLDQYPFSTLHGHLPHLVFVITGRGPLKSEYERKISALELRFCEIHTVWLAADDYPKLLSSADLGVCLHTSSSGLDLPMKVLDMFGSGLPVLAIHYPTLSELVHHGQNGFEFHDWAELRDRLHLLLVSQPESLSTIHSFVIQHESPHRFPQEWTRTLGQWIAHS